MNDRSPYFECQLTTSDGQKTFSGKGPTEDDARRNALTLAKKRFDPDLSLEDFTEKLVHYRALLPVEGEE